MDAQTAAGSVSAERKLLCTLTVQSRSIRSRFHRKVFPPTHAVFAITDVRLAIKRTS